MHQIGRQKIRQRLRGYPGKVIVAIANQQHVVRSWSARVPVSIRIGQEISNRLGIDLAVAELVVDVKDVNCGDLQPLAARLSSKGWSAAESSPPRVVVPLNERWAPTIAM